MSNLVRSAKSTNNWTGYDLTAYHITVRLVQPAEFFCSGPNPSLDHIDSKILTSIDVDDPSMSDTASRYLAYLEMATHASPNQDSIMDDFARETLSLLGFDERNERILTTRYNIPYNTFRESKENAQADVCLLYRPALVLLVLVVDKVLTKTDPEAHVIADAIAAFQFNNRQREDMGRPKLESMTIPCITMSRTRPTFYLVPVTNALSEAVITRQYPSVETTVLKCLTITGQYRDRHGMAGLEYRKLALGRFLAFKMLAQNHWQDIVQGYNY
ncbi:hypothetical protein M422DRAFT_255886 [Sphaerobolus stellatus SS14]|uniref:Unplaced genomic scaffold SPHSTscaffold_344, whole genome shotgun sequence n=1 Tax=Sphaerobolus stellatus (strain SS14) TaxID=990650 RepID=A0A0C9UIZ4_SPHS4|nr:hypothetical protein M422DRAFT_273675 [Sphaerobolus stellatus SS14]KIJ41036.1 hypothetical protein M422DRAFT_255886 [Sphaerobolus stellatus SS14]